MPFVIREPKHIVAPNPGLYAGAAAILEYNGLVFNDRRLVDQIRITKITGLDDPDVEATSEPNPDQEGETPLDPLYRGRTMTLTGYIQAGSFNRMEYLWGLVKDAFDDLGEKPLNFRWLDFKELFIDSGALVDYGFDAGPGTVTIAADGSGLAPSTIVNKRLQLAPNGTFATTPPAGAPYSYGDAEHIVAVNSAVMSGVIFGPELRRTSAAQTLRVIYDHDNTRLALYKVVAGTPTLLDSVSGTLAPGTSYVVARAEGGVVTYSIWSSPPTDFGTPLATKTFTLSGGDQAIFPSAGAGYRSGAYWTPNSTADRLKLFDLAAINPGDAQINCRKFAKIEKDDEQVDGRYRRNFLISLRASDPKLVSRKLSIVSAVPGAFSLIFPGGGGGLTFPADGSGLMFGAALGTITNLGRSPATPIIRAYGSAQNPALINSRNGSRIGINGTIPDGDFYEFDCFNRTVVDSAGVSRYEYLTDLTNWIKLERGANPIIIGADAVGANGLIKFFFRHSSR